MFFAAVDWRSRFPNTWNSNLFSLITIHVLRSRDRISPLGKIVLLTNKKHSSQCTNTEDNFFVVVNAGSNTDKSYWLVVYPLSINLPGDSQDDLPQADHQNTGIGEKNRVDGQSEDQPLEKCRSRHFAHKRVENEGEDDDRGTEGIIRNNQMKIIYQSYFCRWS